MIDGVNDDLVDHAVGALLGLAVGDAVGTTLEFSSRDTQPPLTDMLGGGPFQLKPGQWTDDTSMALALALAYSLLRGDAFDPRDCMARFVNWYRWGDNSCTGEGFDIGVTTAEALQRFERSGDPFSGSTSPLSAGNGSLMRLSPVAIWGAGRTDEEIMEVARQQSRLTHGADECVDACVGFALLTAYAIRGANRNEVLATNPLPGVGKVADVFGGSWRAKSRDQISSSGYVVHSLEAALWCVANTEAFDQAILLAANLADDADTVAAITGQLAGALYGASGIPRHWRERLAWHDDIVELASRLLDGRAEL